MNDTASFVCTHCGESSVIEVDPFGGACQSYVEDCQVCCHPTQLVVHVDPETLEVNVSTEGGG